jgi:hypothetical protein
VPFFHCTEEPFVADLTPAAQKLFEMGGQDRIKDQYSSRTGLETVLDLNFSDRMKEKFLIEYHKNNGGAKNVPKPRPLRTDALDRLFRSPYCQKLEHLTFEHWYPPPPQEHTAMIDRHELKLKKREDIAMKEVSEAATPTARAEAQAREPKHKKQGLEKQEAFLKNYSIPSMLWSLVTLTELRFYNMVRIDEWRDPSTNRRIRVTSSFIKEIPANISALTNLQTLVLSRSGLEKIGADIFPRLTNLQCLNLPQNELTELPSQIGSLTKLTRLSVHSNRLKNIPETILQLTSLKELLAHNNYLGALPTSIPQYLTRLQDLKAVVQRERGSTTPRSMSASVQFLFKDEEKAIQNKEAKFMGLFKYLDEARKGLMKLNRCKLMLVGDGGIGKSKLGSFPLVFFSQFVQYLTCLSFLS